MNKKFEDYTEGEFLKFVQDIFEMNTTSDREHELWAIHFGEVTQHPRSWDLIFYPNPGEDNTPLGVVNEVKQWRAANNLPGFKEN